MTRHPEQNVYGRYPVLPGETTEAITDFWASPPTVDPGEDFHARVVLVDQYGNEHKVKRVAFTGEVPKKPTKSEPAGESIFSIADPIEKEVVAVLKAEVNRYRACGRRVGGLGSIQTVIKGETNRGFGTEWREPESPKDQSIVHNQSEASVVSDNANALLKFYRSLANDAERSTFVKALMSRLSRSTEYASVGYFIVYIMFEIDHLAKALEKAKQDLRGDDAYGFSDVLRLIDGLLRCAHGSFTPRTLEDVERLVHDVDEDRFCIQERLAAIRAYRLTQSQLDRQGP